MAFTGMSSFYSQLGSNLGQSVVPDLMQVYESLTQSKTPQFSASQQSAPSAHQDAPPPAHSQLYQHQNSQPIAASSPHSHCQYNTAQHQLPQQHSFSQAHAPLHGHNQHQIHYLQPQTHYYHHSAPSQHIELSYTHHPSAIHSSAPPSAVPRIDISDQNKYSQHHQIPSQPQSSGATQDDDPSDGSTTRKRSLTGSDKSGSDSESVPLKTRKKRGCSDGRWSKRFSWPDELHRDFVAAVFDVGLKHASPSSILEQMPKHDSVTSERIKSHLQKYRLHRQKSKKEFMASYDSSISKLNAGAMDTDPQSMTYGEVAAHLSYSTATQKDGPEAVNGGDVDPNPIVQGGALQLPQLSDEEKASPVGASMGYLMGLFFSLKQQLMLERAAKKGVDPPAANSSNFWPVIVHPTSQPLVQSPYISSGTPNSAPSNHIGSVYASSTFTSQRVEQRQHTVLVPAGVPIPQLAQASPAPQHTYRWQAIQSDSSAPAGQQSEKPVQMGPTSSGAQTTEIESQEASTSSVLPTLSPGARSSSTVEESHMMKREMQNQMAFQNKMRALKQQELNKYKSANNNGQPIQDNSNYPSSSEHAANSGFGSASPEAEDKKLCLDSGEKSEATDCSERLQGASEEAMHKADDFPCRKAQEESVGNSEDFWNTDVVDDQLFEFLMNN